MPTTRTDGGPDEDLDDRVWRLHRHLEATAELPIEPTTNRWLGEAAAIARDAATNDLEEATTRRRVEQVRHLLAEAGETGHEAADERLDAARRVCDRILDESDA